MFVNVFLLLQCYVFSFGKGKRRNILESFSLQAAYTCFNFGLMISQNDIRVLYYLPPVGKCL